MHGHKVLHCKSLSEHNSVGMVCLLRDVPASLDDEPRTLEFDLILGSAPVEIVRSIDK